ncbi:MAG: DPP IV N-terminal domain-containing protein [Flavobacteriales bacterium]|nr:DPP IV N-terminal domain-containing protein [Flavobacteriales bacterium]
MSRCIKLLLATATLLVSLPIAAQQQLTLRDAILKAGTDLAPQRIKGLQWIKDADSYSFVDGDALKAGFIGKRMDETIVDLATLNAALDDTVKLRAIPAVEWESADRFRFMHRNGVHVFDRGKGDLEKRLVLPEGAERLDTEERSGRVAFTLGEDMHIAFPGGETRRVTHDGTDGIVNGRSVHREEYGITKGTFWAPGGERIAFYRMDESMVALYQLEDLATKPSTFTPLRYPMAGQTSHHVSVGVHDVRSGRTVFLKHAGAPDDYLTNISWSPDGRHVHVTHLDRKTENLRLVRYDATTGDALATLHNEQDKKYLEPQHPGHFLEGRAGHYLWWSQSDGWWHLYLRHVQRGAVRQLTRGRWVVKDVLGLDPKESTAWVSGTGEIDPMDPKGAMETHLYRVDLLSGKTQRLTNEPGTHRGQLSSDGRYLIDQWSSLTIPGRTVIRDARTGEVMKNLLDAPDPLKDHVVGTVESLTIPGENGAMLNARLIKPSHFQPRNRYPVLIYVYNGPHVRLVGNSFLGAAPLWMLEAAERGYIVWTLDGHGSADRGRDFEQAIHRQLGITEVKDQMHGVAWLEKQPFVDPERIAVHGWSYGGHMTTAMLLRHPGRFKVGVAGGPVMDWTLYEVMYTERYMDTPEENPEGYAATALPPLAGQLQDDLLLISGVRDDVVLPQHSLSLIKACVDAGVQLDYFAYPGHGHNVRGKDRLHLMEKVLRHIDQRMLFMR